MSLNVVNLPNGATDPTGQNRLLGKLFNQSGVIQSTAFTVGAPGGMFVSISGSLNNDDAVFIASDGSTYGGWNTANITTQAVASNGTGATRYDAVVLYVDTTAGNPSTGTPNNPGALKILLVRSTNTSPTLTGDITASAVGTKPYIRLADVLVGAGVSSINAGNLADTRPIAGPIVGTIGYAQITSNFVPGTISTTDVTGLSVTVNVPAGGRRIKITCKADVYSPVGAQGIALVIQEGATTLQTSDTQVTTLNKVETSQFSAITTPSAGSHTYKVAISVDTISASTPAIQASSGSSAFILVEAI